MTRKAFDKIASGLSEALAVARGQSKPARMFIPSEIDVRAIRQSVGMSQEDFAATFGFSLTQIRDWEQGRARPLAGLRSYLSVIQRDPRTVLKILHSAPTVRRRKVA